MTDEFVGSVVEAVRPHRADGRGEAWQRLVASHQLIEDWLKKDGLTVVKVHDLLGRRGIVVPQRTLHRYALEVCDVGRGRRGTTVRVNDGEPGDECQIDFGTLGLVFDSDAGRVALHVRVALVPSDDRRCDRRVRSSVGVRWRVRHG